VQAWNPLHSKPPYKPFEAELMASRGLQTSDRKDGGRKMKDKVQKQYIGPGAAPPAAHADPPHRAEAEDDPRSWYGLAWRIARAALENDENFRRLCVLIILVAVVVTVWLAAGLVPLCTTRMIPYVGGELDRHSANFSNLRLPASSSRPVCGQAPA